MVAFAQAEGTAVRGPLRPAQLARPGTRVRAAALRSSLASSCSSKLTLHAAKPGASLRPAGWLARPGPSRVATISAAAAVSVDQPTPAELISKFPAVQPLPPPPTSARLVDVVPYLLKLAVSERGLRWRLAAAFGCMIIAKTAGLTIPLMFKLAIDALATGGTEAAVKSALQFIIAYGALDMVKNLAKESQSPIFTPVSQAVTRRLAYHTFSWVLDLDTRFHLDRRTGRVSRILERGTRSVGVLYRALLFTFTPTFIELLAVCFLLSQRFGSALGAIVGGTFAIYVTWTVSMTQAATDVRKEVNALDNSTTSKAVDALLNYETVTLFNAKKLEVGQYDHFLQGFQSASIRTERLSAMLNAGQALILASGMVAVMVACVSSGNATGGDLVLCQALIAQAWAPLMFLGWFYRELRASLVDMDEFFQILQTQPNIRDGPHELPKYAPSAVHVAAAAAANGGNGLAPEHVVMGERSSGVAGTSGRSSSSSTGGASNGALSGKARGLEVELDDVHFSYTEGRKILKGVSLRVAPGERVAVVGPSGSGKSTILRLVTRLYDVAGGAVRLNGLNVRDLKLGSVRDAVAVVPQDTILNYESIMENIRYGRPEATDEEVIEAATAAKLHDTVTRLEKGYHTVVGERGLKLSGGEKQRVAIARAFLRSPRLLVCDEATSALDTATEAAIMTSLSELAEGRSAIFVAHRLSTVRTCDRIVVLRDGRVEEEGSHDGLMAAKGTYWRMWELQASQADSGLGDGSLMSVDEADLAHLDDVLHISNNGDSSSLQQNGDGDGSGTGAAAVAVAAVSGTTSST